ncbi:OB-fold domain-containing protein [Gammaproteobacteria bacterium]|nr:OB-fold domain-containing protein [Gammaproteobacteria bacterium]
MSESVGEPWLPKPNSRNAPFFEAASEGKLRLQCCDKCETWTFPYRDRCQHCGSESMVWRDTSGRGTLYSHGLLRRAYHPRHEDRLPIILAQVDMLEGVRLSTNLVDVEPDAVRVGMEVEMVSESLPDGGAIPVFRPVAD